MTSLREALAGLLTRTKSEASAPSEEDVSFAYRLYWTRQARDWPKEKRARVMEQVVTVLTDPEFEPSTYERLYPISEADQERHAGASVQSLSEVLQALEVYES